MDPLCAQTLSVRCLETNSLLTYDDTANATRDPGASPLASVATSFKGGIRPHSFILTCERVCCLPIAPDLRALPQVNDKKLMRPMRVRLKYKQTNGAMEE